MKIFDTIKATVSLEELFSVLWVNYRRHWQIGYLMERWKPTNGWRCNFAEWIVSDFSNKWRPSWDLIKFTKEFLSLPDNNEALKFFSERFNIKLDYKMEKKAYDLIKEKWDNLPWLNQEQKDYLHSRWITTDIARNNWWFICLPIRTVNWQIISLQSRNIDTTSSLRYRVEKNSDSDWLFIEWLNKDEKKLIVVEWMTDFLSIRQYTTNVVWLFNSSSEGQLRAIKELSNIYSIYFIPDNDEAWKVTIDKLRALWVRFNLFNLDDYWVKDSNELITSFNIWEWILEAIYMDSQRPPSNIRLAVDKAKVYRQMYKDNWWKLWFPTWYKYIDELTWWIIKWKTYLVMAFSNVWKTRFAYSLIRWMLREKKKIQFYSLEVDTWMLIIELLSSVYQMSREEVLDKIDNFNLDEIEQYVEIYDHIRSMDDIERNIMETKPDVAIIDFVQNIENKWMEYEKMTDIALRIQKIGILSWTSMISLSQVNNESRFTDWNTMSPKWSWALFASSDVIISLWAKEWEKFLTITKNKFWPAWTTFMLEVDYAKSIFNMSPDIWERLDVKKSFKSL